MSSLTIHEEVEIDASPDRVWAYLVEPQRVVACLPGAAIEGSDGERSFRGSMRVKVGPANMTYRGVAEFVELDEGARRMRLEGKGTEKAGGGQVQMVMESTVEAVEGGRSRIVVDVDVKLAGKIVKFGRGMIGVVSERLFQDFAECLAQQLAGPQGAEPGAAARAGGTAGVHGGGQEGAEAPPPARPRELGAIGLVLRAVWSRIRRLWARDH